MSTHKWNRLNTIQVGQTLNLELREFQNSRLKLKIPKLNQFIVSSLLCCRNYTFHQPIVPFSDDFHFYFKRKPKTMTFI
jgi:hypothetical protein